jgi:hypothetical protein
MASGSQSSGVNRIWSLGCIYNKVSKLQANFYTFLQILQGYVYMSLKFLLQPMIYIASYEFF